MAQEYPLAIHRHELPSGEIVKSIGHQELGLQEDDELYGVNFTELLLQLAVGRRGSTQYLNTYKVQYNLSKLVAKLIWI